MFKLIINNNINEPMLLCQKKEISSQLQTSVVYDTIHCVCYYNITPYIHREMFVSSKVLLSSSSALMHKSVIKI